MKEQYIKQVLRKLTVSPARKKEIARDLEEVFASASENNETEEQVIARLGSPKEFAANVYEARYNKAVKKVRPVVMAFIAVASLAMYLQISMQYIPANAIGQADAITNMQVSSNLPLNLPQFILAIGIIALFIMLFDAVKFIIKYRRNL